ncbi:MAG TPA: GNAT family N-acetyltransferase [Gaiellales bacterium]|nr:GNAT family N-acetyltransferase [Gaiellales bacterium]
MAFPEGYGVRPPVTADGPVIVDMINAESRALRGVAFTSLEWVTAPWTAPGANLERDFGVVTGPDGDLAAYFFIESEPPHTSIFSIGAVGLEHHGRGVGAAVVEELERRAEAFAAAAPAGEQVVWRMGGLAEEPLVARLLSDHGFGHPRVFWVMKRAFDGPPEPAADVPGVTFELVSPGGEEEVYPCLAEAFEDHYGDGLPARDVWLHTHVTAIERHDPSLWHVARRDGVVVGALLGQPVADEDPTLGYVALFGVRRSERGRGVGQSLLRRSFTQFHERGRAGVMLFVDSESTTGATRVYERAGMTSEPRFCSWERVLRTA